MKEKTYTEKDIEVLSDRDHVRKRLPIYAGSISPRTYNVPFFFNNKIEIKEITFIPSVFKCSGEIIENSIDELTQLPPSHPKLIKIDAQPLLGIYGVSDSGRGVPIGKHTSGKFTPEVVFGSLRSGRNFSDDKEAGVIGVNGMGASITNYCSTEFSIDIHRDGKRYRQKFSNGGLDVSKPSIRKQLGGDNKTGTSVSFQLDDEVFEDISLPVELIKNRAIEIALTNPGFSVEYNNKIYKFRRGLEDIVSKISENYFKFQMKGIEIFVIFDSYEGTSEQMFSWVNSSLLFDGGICNTQFINAFYAKTTQHLEAAAKKQKCKIAREDITQDLLILANLKLSDPEYDAQSKTRLTGPNLRSDFTSMLDEKWGCFIKKNKDWLNTVLERAMLRYHAQENKKAVKNHQKNLSRKVPGLIDATNKRRDECQLLVTEGKSAASMITDARDPTIHASLPLTGKINNVNGTTVAQLLKMGKVTDLITAIGLVPGQRAMRSQLNYGKVIIATDADVDGGDIFTLLVNLFFTFWPELFDKKYEPYIYRLVAPNVCLVKGKKRIHFPTRGEYEKGKNRYKGYAVKYFKGLGSMIKIDWEMILSGKTDTLIPITDDGKMKETLELLFGPDAQKRKEWLQ